MFSTWRNWLQRKYRPSRNPAATRYPRPRIELLENRLVLSSFQVTNTNDFGPGSLRDAINQVNNDSGSAVDTITFAILSGPQTIIPQSPLPEITHPVIVDGTTQPGFAGTPLVELDGASAGSSADGLTVGAGNSTIKGLAINRFRNDGILLEGTGNDSVTGSFIGTDVTGTQALANGGFGIEVDSAANTIGGTTAQDRNLISGNSSNGIFITGSSATGNVVEGDYIGTNINGTQSLSNSGNGVTILSASNNVVGGTASGSGNLISGNTFSGVALGSLATNNLVEGNLLGTDVSGKMALGNLAGVAAFFAFDNTIGGTVAGAGNVISANQFMGIFFEGEASDNLVQGNLIGTDVTGTQALGNAQIGVGMELGASFNTIGGTTAAARNIISANGIEGIELDDSNKDLIEGNYIGTDATGTVALGNATYGIDVSFTGSVSGTIGGTASGAANVISGNGSDGVFVRTLANALLEGNLIGTDATGTRPLGNGGNGVRVRGGRATIGGSAAGAGNLISANGADGIRLDGSPNSLVQSNKIGTDISGALPFGNGGNGVDIDGSDNTIGGAGSGNVIDFNALDGVFVNSGTGNLISQNSIFSNGGLGIELNAANNANNSQAAPVLMAAVSANGMTLVVGSFTSTPNTTFTLEFFANTACDPSGFGEGQTFLGSITVTTDSKGNAHFTARFAFAVPPGEFIAATATDPSNDTSEFSNCKVVNG